MDSVKLRLAKRDLVRDILPTLQTGDIILTSYGSIIVKFMRLFQKDKVNWGHCLVVKDSSTAWEAHWRLREYSLSKFFSNKSHWRIARKKDITEAQRAIMMKVSPQLIGRFYGIDRIFLQFLDHIFKTNKFSSIDESVYNQVCSSFVAWIYEIACRYKFNSVPWMSCDPDDIEDDWEKYPDRWEIIEEQLP